MDRERDSKLIGGRRLELAPRERALIADAMIDVQKRILQLSNLVL